MCHSSRPPRQSIRLAMIAALEFVQLFRLQKVQSDIKISKLASILSRIEIPKDLDDCWRWVGQLDDDGYGKLNIVGLPIKAHRATYEIWRGPLPDKNKHGEVLVLDHTCRVRRCINPYHTDPVTHEINILRGKEARAVERLQGKIKVKTHCSKGHAMTPENIKMDNKGGGRMARLCRICYRERVNAKMESKRANGFKQKPRKRIQVDGRIIGSVLLPQPKTEV